MDTSPRISAAVGATAGAPPPLCVGLPVYNGGLYLREALDTILNQTFGDFELFVSDNASTDGTPEILSDYAARDRRVSVERQSVNRGGAWNFNRVFHAALCRGSRWFKWMSHDDVHGPDFLRLGVETLKEDPWVMSAYTGTTHIDAVGNRHWVYRDGPDFAAADPVFRWKRYFEVMPRYPIFGVMPTQRLARTALWQTFPSSDRVLMGEMCLHGRFVEHPDPIFYRRVHRDVSYKVGMSDAAYATWFDPANAGKRLVNFTAPARRVAAYAAAAWRAPLTPSQRARCVARVCTFSLSRTGNRAEWVFDQRARRGKNPLEKTSRATAVPPPL